MVNQYGGALAVGGLYNSLNQNISLNNQLKTDGNLNEPLTAALSHLRELRALKILHPEWLQFSHNDVRTFMEDDLAGIVITTMEEHRNRDFNTIKDFISVPVWTIREPGQSGDLLCPIQLAGYRGDTPTDEALTVLELMMTREFQETLNFKTGLGPVNSNSLALDKQSSDLRYWAAASQEIIPYFPGSKSISTYSSYLGEVRNYLIANR